jgi:hypothetical protein
LHSSLTVLLQLGRREQRKMSSNGDARWTRSPKHWFSKLQILHPDSRKRFVHLRKRAAHKEGVLLPLRSSNPFAKEENGTVKSSSWRMLSVQYVSDPGCISYTVHFIELLIIKTTQKIKIKLLSCCKVKNDSGKRRGVCRLFFPQILNGAGSLGRNARSAVCTRSITFNHRQRKWILWNVSAVQNGRYRLG